MGIIDAVKGLLSGEGLSGILESAGVEEHLDGLLGEGSAIAGAVGVDLGQATESLSLDGVVESLPGEGLPESPDSLGG
jgi:hypothetical protein